MLKKSILFSLLLGVSSVCATGADDLTDSAGRPSFKTASLQTERSWSKAPASIGKVEQEKSSFFISVETPKVGASVVSGGDYDLLGADPVSKKPAEYIKKSEESKPKAHHFLVGVTHKF